MISRMRLYLKKCSLQPRVQSTLAAVIFLYMVYIFFETRVPLPDFKEFDGI